MDNATPAEVLLRLLGACSNTENDARQLAQSTEIEPMKSFLHESARQYRSAANDLSSALSAETRVEPDPPGPTHRQVVADESDDVAELWERAECDALTYFRDAYDTALPSALADTIKRHYEAGVARLERLRRMQTRR